MSSQMEIGHTSQLVTYETIVVKIIATIIKEITNKNEKENNI
jgi:hypothetical protein